VGHKKAYSVSNAIIIFDLLLITTPDSAVGNECPVGSYLLIPISCSGGCPCPSASGMRSGTIYGQEGTQYNNNMDCEWIISSENTTFVYSSAFSLEPGFDWVYIDTCTSSLCDTSTRLDSLSGFIQKSSTYVSTTGYLRIQFKSNHLTKYTGFALQWSVGGSEFDSSLCALCAAGKYKIDPSNALCTDCMSNQFSTEVGATTDTCQACLANSVSLPGSNVCDCNAGWTRSDEGGPCVQCAAGKYKVETGNSACVHCIAGKYSSRVGATVEYDNCLNCRPGKSTLGLDARTDLTECVECIPGKYATNYGNAECALCSPGKYIWLSGYSRTCYNCLANQYSPAWGADAADVCQTCPANTASPAGSNDQTDCKCQAGWTESTGSCVQCGAGKYKNVVGDAACVDCVAGTYSTKLGANSITSCVGCAAGKYSVEVGAISDVCQTYLQGLCRTHLHLISKVQQYVTWARLYRAHHQTPLLSHDSVSIDFI